MKKGFTLIELLAVIVILAIIALIATPIILNIIGSTKEQTTLESGELYLRAVRNAIATENLLREFNPSTCEVTEEGNLNCDGEELVVETNGERPNNGYIELEEGKIVYVEELLLGDYELETDEDLKLVIADPNREKPCRVKYPTTTPNAPDLMNNSLVPVKYNGTNWVITTSGDSSWYNYTKQEWANAVILKDGVSNEVGKTLTLPTSTSDIESSDVKAIFVWIPRYEYKIDGQYGMCGTDAKNPGAIDIKFVDSSKTTADENYIMHPAFTFGEDELSGIWVGKFETSAEVGSNCYNTASDANCDNINQEPYILPNVPSLRYQTVGNQFETAKKFSSYINNSGDSHMMKNSEWGAVAYLTQSKYGKYGNKDYTGANKEVYKNDSSSYYTGRSLGKPSTIVDEYSPNGTCKYDEDGSNRDTGTGLCGPGASTTGNITGIYDMSGGAYEYVMGYLTIATTDTELPWGSTSSKDYAKFASQPDPKYFDAYTDKNNEAYKGHALGETSGWYSDSAVFVFTDVPWFIRGCNYSNMQVSGVFNFSSLYGISNSDNTFRVVFAPTT